MHKKFPGGGLFRRRPRGSQNPWSGSTCTFLVVVVGMTLLAAATSWAQDDWGYTLPGRNEIERGPGDYFSKTKLGILWGLYVLWIWIVNWVNGDCKEHKFDYAKWIPIVAAPFLVGFFLFALLIPIFWVGAPLCLLTILVPAVVYVLMRNEEVEPHQQVMTPPHFRYLFATALGAIGIKMSVEAKKAHEKGAQVDFTAFGGDKDQDGQANLIRARQSPGYVACKQMVADAVEVRAEKIMLDCNAASVSARHQIDGVWHDTDGADREEGDDMISALKLIANMNPEERKARQKGQVAVKFEGKKYFCSVVSQGTKTGERVIASLGSKGNKFSKLEELGMREPVIKVLKEKMLQEGGILLFSALPSGGLTTTFTASINSTDRLLRDFVSIEPHNDRMPEVENVDPVALAEGETIHEKLPGILRKDADVLVIPKLTDTESVTALCKAAKDRLVFMQTPAKESVEAMLRVLMMKVPIKDFASVVSTVVNQRLIRKLCEDCKEGYKPSAAQLQKLRLPANRVDQFYKPPVVTPEDKQICPTCNGLGYFGRSSIFEVVEVKENLRKTLLTQPKLELLRKAARADGNRTLQEEGILAVVQGITSLAEIQRVLKQ